jgi:hypothetical protein
MSFFGGGSSSSSSSASSSSASSSSSLASFLISELSVIATEAKRRHPEIKEVSLSVSVSVSLSHFLSLSFSLSLFLSSLYLSVLSLYILSNSIIFCIYLHLSQDFINLKNIDAIKLTLKPPLTCVYNTDCREGAK